MKEILFSLEKPKKGKEIFLFYFLYFAIFLFISTFLGAVIGLRAFDTIEIQRSAGFKMSLWIVATCSVGLAFVILQKKGLEYSVKLIVLGLISIPLSLYGGALLGVIPATYLSTLKPAKK